jgi:uncharacterized membrane protein
MKMWNSRGIAPGIFQMNWPESNSYIASKPMERLKIHYERGEITEEEFNRIRKELQCAPSLFEEVL